MSRERDPGHGSQNEPDDEPLELLLEAVLEGAFGPLRRKTVQEIAVPELCDHSKIDREDGTTLFEGFNFSALDDPDFKEDAVREELLAPLIKRLGYSPSGEDRVIRGKALKHPFVAIGTKKQNVTVIPDYIVRRKDDFHWILDAKGPRQEIHSGKHVEQAYSYAIHPEVRAPIYALCNGYDFVLFSVRSTIPILSFKLRDISEHWGGLFSVLGTRSASPFNIPPGFKPDYGLWLINSGIRQFNEQEFFLIFPSIPVQFVSRVEETTYSLTGQYFEEGKLFKITVDFESELLEEFLRTLPVEVTTKTKLALKRQPFCIAFEPRQEVFTGVTAKLGRTKCTNGMESYCPFNAETFYQASDRDHSTRE